MTGDEAKAYIEQIPREDLQVVLHALCNRIQVDRDVRMVWAQITTIMLNDPGREAVVDHVLADLRRTFLERT